MFDGALVYAVKWRQTAPDLDPDPDWKLTLREEPCQPWLSQEYEEAEAYARPIRIKGTETQVVAFPMTLKKEGA